MGRSGLIASIACQANVSLQLEPEYDFVRAGRSLNFDAAIMNLGPMTATTTTLTLQAGPGAHEIEPVPPDPACEFEGGVLTCSYGNLLQGANLSRQFVLHAAEGTTAAISLVGTLGTAAIECDASNDSDSVLSPVLELSSSRIRWEKFR